MKPIPILLFSMTVFAGCGREATQPPPPAVGLHEAALRGDTGAIRSHVAAGSDLDARDEASGSCPLMVAATFGQTEAARALIEGGADVNARNNEGSTPLLTAAFLCRTEIVELLLEHGADKQVRNNAGATALEAVSAPFDTVKAIYDFLGAALAPAGLELDYDRIKTTRPKIAEMLR